MNLPTTYSLFLSELYRFTLNLKPPIFIYKSGSSPFLSYSMYLTRGVPSLVIVISLNAVPISTPPLTKISNAVFIVVFLALNNTLKIFKSTPCFHFNGFNKCLLVFNNFSIPIIAVSIIPDKFFTAVNGPDNILDLILSQNALPNTSPLLVSKKACSSSSKISRSAPIFASFI